MRQFIFILTILSAVSCSKVISSATKSVVDCVTVPLKNKEIQLLQSNIIIYWLKYDKTWPNDNLTLMKFSHSSGLKLTPKFANLSVTNFVDSVLANYQLIYEESDTSEYKSITGALSIKVSRDTTINIRHHIDRVEMKNGVSCESQDSNYLTKIVTEH